MINTTHIEEGMEHDERGWMVKCSCGWMSEPQPTEDEATSEHSGHANQMAAQESDG